MRFEYILKMISCILPYLYIIIQFHSTIRMSDDLKQMMAKMMAQMEQQQRVISKLSNELALKKQEDKYSTSKQFISKLTFPPPSSQFDSKVELSSFNTKKQSFKTSRIQCPENHYSYKIYYSYQFCNSCQQKKTSGKRCMECNYKVCAQCQQLDHKNLCMNEAWRCYESYQFCLLCRQKSSGGKKCQQCSFNICLQCEALTHQFLCKSKQLAYYDNYLFCWGCRQKKTGGKKCKDCGYRRCKSCQQTKPL